MATTILGLDIGGANLKAATADKRAISVPFPLWKQPDKLPTALAELVAQFPDTEELAVTMTGELCDCFETKRDGVHAIVQAIEAVAACRVARVWSTEGVFLNCEEAKHNHMKVAAANWHALATFAGRFAPNDGGLLLDIGSTTTDIVTLRDGAPRPIGKQDKQRLYFEELVYVGVLRTPVCAVYTDRVCAELFATTQDAYAVLGLIPEDPDNRGTADGRPLTIDYSLARLARMWGADRDTMTCDEITHFASVIHKRLVERLAQSVRKVYFQRWQPDTLRTVVLSGAGEFLARSVIDAVLEDSPAVQLVSLNDRLGPSVSACAPAYAVAVLATERRP